MLKHVQWTTSLLIAVHKKKSKVFNLKSMRGGYVCKLVSTTQLKIEFYIFLTLQ